jgi:aspartate racemase
VSGKIVGIIGGMGPEATVDLMSRIIKATSAEDDIDHIRMVVDNNPKVPSRIKALLDGGGESPVHCLQDMARRLAAWGVDFLAMPCNTAHYFHKDIQDAVSIPVLDMIALAAARTADSNPGVETVGLLASTATINLNIYEQGCSPKGSDTPDAGTRGSGRTDGCNSADQDRQVWRRDGNGAARRFGPPGTGGCRCLAGRMHGVVRPVGPHPGRLPRA